MEPSLEELVTPIKKKKRYLVFRPPHLFIYRYENDTFCEDHIPVDMFILKIKNDNMGHRLTLTRAHKVERKLNNDIKQTAQQMVGVGKLQNIYIFTSEDQGTISLDDWFEILSPHCLNTGRTKVFGVPLKELVKKQLGKSYIPELVSSTIRYLDVNGLEVEGIFRLSGNNSVIMYYKDLYDIGEKPSLDTINDPHNVAGLFKMFLRELPEPILTHDLYPKFMQITVEIPEKSEKAKKMIEVLDQLPDANFLLLKSVLSLCRRVSQYSDVNKMTLNNLALIFGSNLLRPRIEPADVAVMLRETTARNEIVQLLIENESLILPRPIKPPESENTKTTKIVPTVRKDKPPPPLPIHQLQLQSQSQPQLQSQQQQQNQQSTQTSSSPSINQNWQRRGHSNVDLTKQLPTTRKKLPVTPGMLSPRSSPATTTHQSLPQTPQNNTSTPALTPTTVPSVSSPTSPTVTKDDQITNANANATSSPVLLSSNSTERKPKPQINPENSPNSSWESVRLFLKS